MCLGGAVFFDEMHSLHERSYSTDDPYGAAIIKTLPLSIATARTASTQNPVACTRIRPAASDRTLSVTSAEEHQWSFVVARADDRHHWNVLSGPLSGLGHHVGDRQSSSRACSALAPALRSASRTTPMPHAVTVTVAFRSGTFAATLRTASYAATPTAPVTTAGTAFASNPCNTIVPNAPFTFVAPSRACARSQSWPSRLYLDRSRPGGGYDISIASR